MSINLTEKLTKSCKDGKFSFGTLIEAIDQLKEAQEIRGYFNTLIDLTEEDLYKKIEEGQDSDAITAIREGKLTIEEASKGLVIDKFAYVLNKYDHPEDKEIHERWKKAVPEIYCISGRLPTILDFLSGFKPVDLYKN